ncbi:MAG: hypothetical protein LBB28_03100 [Synergistaceae bacterium]|jgi:hypothetical protein|nr:hypothetical protein [Synergistaceae bacterium]
MIMILFPEMTEQLDANEYLEHKYEISKYPALSLPDEDAAVKWDIWLARPDTAPLTIRDILSDGEAWLENTPAGRIPVIYTTSRENFLRTLQLLNPGASVRDVPGSVNAFTINSRSEDALGHRVILLNEAGYSGVSGKEMGMTEDEWIEKSMTLRLHHETCHYFSLRVLGGMKNHALDETAADCAGQLAALGTFSAALQKRFFGISEGNVLPGGRFSFYMKNLRDDAVREVIRAVETALSSLERYLARSPNMAAEPNRSLLITKILGAGIRGCGDF